MYLYNVLLKKKKNFEFLSLQNLKQSNVTFVYYISNRLKDLKQWLEVNFSLGRLQKLPSNSERLTKFYTHALYIYSTKQYLYVSAGYKKIVFVFTLFFLFTLPLQTSLNPFFYCIHFPQIRFDDANLIDCLSEIRKSRWNQFHFCKHILQKKF